ncbi:hypothetical protein PVOR_11840 [Paenibacillus vortex V453]|uniref:Uncharacterized protein n=1 Tax=Paenibacillus vortex V453 TaxID=715225 RepID=A0A2R9SW97_9BACL|nr:hypothetical protein PVOR_11840 [Paenibacillus vortex V453]
MYGMYILFIILIIVGVTPTFYRLYKRINLLEGIRKLEHVD